MSTESPISEPPNLQDPTPPVTLVLTILLLVMFFVGFFSIYFCRCFVENILNSLNNRHTPNGTPINTIVTPPGLDKTVVNSFPTFTYASVKDYRREKYGLECAICLCEFDENDFLRLLPNCSHVFHQECIDLWFESHKSCPVCRRNLDVLDTKQSSEKIPNVIEGTPININNNSNNNNNSNSNVNNQIVDENINSSLDDAISIAIKEDIHDDEEPFDEGHKPSFDKRHIHNNNACINNERFSRSHSTGHSILRKRVIMEDDDKYTLKLPEHIKESLTRRHIVTLSCTTFDEYSSNSTKKLEGFGEISGCATQGDDNKV